MANRGCNTYPGPITANGRAKTVTVLPGGVYDSSNWLGGDYNDDYIQKGMKYDYNGNLVAANTPFVFQPHRSGKLRDSASDGRYTYLGTSNAVYRYDDDFLGPGAKLFEWQNHHTGITFDTKTQTLWTVDDNCMFVFGCGQPGLRDGYAMVRQWSLDGREIFSFVSYTTIRWHGDPEHQSLRTVHIAEAAGPLAYDASDNTLWLDWGGGRRVAEQHLRLCGRPDGQSCSDNPYPDIPWASDIFPGVGRGFGVLFQFSMSGALLQVSQPGLSYPVSRSHLFITSMEFEVGVSPVPETRTFALGALGLAAAMRRKGA